MAERTFRESASIFISVAIERVISNRSAIGPFCDLI